MSGPGMFVTALPRLGAGSLLALSLLFAGGCQTHSTPPRGAYRVVWSAHRAKDNRQLAVVTSPVFGVGGSVDVRTDSRTPDDDLPALPRFTATLSPDRLRANTLELVTRAYVKEIVRTPKGKRKLNRRVIGGLLPIDPGETQEFEGPGDAIRVEAHLEGGGGTAK